MSYEVRVLGPVSVRRDSAEIDLGHARQRVLLAILATRVGAVTPTDRLVELLWPQDPPRSARDTLYSYLSRLRRLFDGPDAAIERRGGGYLLDIAPEAVDMNRFRDLVARARDGGAVADWDAALALWRGEPFADIDIPPLDQVRSTLDAEHFAAVLDRNDALLAAGEHARALPELWEGVGRFPHDERLAGQLMLALYRGGRPCEAQDHFLAFRRRLIAERGTEPGAALSRLHRAILTEAAELAEPPSVPAAAVPRQLPAAKADVTGRAGELAELDAARSRRRRCVVVSGAAGVGKTALARHWAHRVAAAFPDGQLYAELRGAGGEPVPPGDVVRGFLAALGVAPERLPAGESARTALYRSLVAERRLLVVLDDARDAEQVRPLLPGGPDCLTLVTSRNQLAGLVITEGAVPVILEPFGENETRGSGP